VTYAVTDGAVGDEDGLVDGVIVDPIDPIVLPGSQLAGIPTLGQWGLWLLAGLLAALVWGRMLSLRTQRRRSVLSL
jgi:hypothetical protein